jgi:putative hydrolase of HD superfamily
LAKEIMETDWTEWWFEKRDDWWAPNNCKPPEDEK